MNKVDIVREAFSFGDPNQVAMYFADDFQFTDGSDRPPMDKAMWFGMGELLKGSFPDIEFVIEDIWEEGENIMVSGYFSGTFMNDLDLSVLGIGVIPASGAYVRFPLGTSQVTFNGDKIWRSHDMDTGPDAGMAGFVKALGVNMG